MPSFVPGCNQLAIDISSVLGQSTRGWILFSATKAAMPRFGNKVLIDGEARTFVLALDPECVKDGGIVLLHEVLPQIESSGYLWRRLPGVVSEAAKSCLLSLAGRLKSALIDCNMSNSQKSFCSGSADLKIQTKVLLNSILALPQGNRLEYAW